MFLRYFWIMSGTLKYLFNMKRLPILIMMLVAGSFLAFKTMGRGTHPTTPPSKYEEILRLVGKMFQEAHYSPQDINDAFSKKVFKKFLKDLDPEKNIFLQSDFNLLKKHEIRVDDEIKGAPVEFFMAAGKTFNTRVEEAAAICNEILATPFDFTVNEEVELDGDKLETPATAAERKDRWRKKIKFLALERYTDLLDTREKNKGKEGFVVKSDEELEKEAREKVKRLTDRTFDRFRHKFNDDDKFSMYVNAITTTMDPHSEFFPRLTKDILMKK